MNVFAQITKVDEAKRMVYARAVQETVDKVDEIFDYTSSKPLFEAWSKEQFDASGGKSYGNVRAMHGKIAAGIVAEPLAFNDADRAIDTAIKVTDDQEWSKCLDGTYTGVSIGGSYVGNKKTEKVDGREVKRYTAKPAEISLVDSPCIPSARFFEIVKADGSIQKAEFKPAASVELVVTGTDEEVEQFAQALNASKMSMQDAIALVRGEAARRAEDAMLDTIESLAKREFSTDERKQAAKEGQALPDGSFPIKTVGDLENAIHAYGRAKDKDAAKAHIIKRAKALGATDKLPKDWTDGAKAAGGNLAKGMWNVQQFASCLDCLASVCRDAQYDLAVEGDNSPVPMQLRNAFAELVVAFKAMAEEESEEALAGLKTAAGVGEDDDIDDVVEQALRVGALTKRLADPALALVDLMAIAEKELDETTRKTLKSADEVRAAVLAKAAGKGSKADRAHLQAAHDHLTAMGAECSGGKTAPDGDLAKAAATIERLERDVAMLKAQPMPHPLVALRAVKREDDGHPDASAKSVPDDLSSIALEPADYIRSSDGTIDYFASRVNKAGKLAAKAAAA